MKILFFSPFSAIAEHSLLEARLANSLRAIGNEVIFITCGEVLDSHCVVMSASGLSPNATTEDRKRACSSCCRNANIYNKIFSLNSISLVDFLSEQDYSVIQELLDLQSCSDKLDLMTHGINVGRRTLYPFLAYKKRDNIKFNEADRLEYIDQLKQSLLVSFCADKIIDEYRPDVVLTYSATYSVLSVFLEVARKRGVKTYFVEATGNYSRRQEKAIFGQDGIGEWYQALRELWDKQRENPARAEGITDTVAHLCHLFNADSVFAYSPPSMSSNKSIRTIFNIPANSKILLATMSSYDEVFSAQEAGILRKANVLFDTQLEWVEWLIDFISERDNLFLILRVHPREFPTRRDSGSGIKSTHAYKLENLLIGLPSNCAVNWPDQNISLYDLAKEVDVILNAWSSAGKEMALLGLPVVEWANEWLLYPPQLMFAAKDKVDYLDKINAAISHGWSGDALINMFRWCSLEFSNSTIDIRQQQIIKNKIYNYIKVYANRIIRRLLPNIYPAFLAKQTPVPFDEIKKLNELFSRGMPTLSHLNQNIYSNLEDEKLAIISAIDLIILNLFANSDDGSSLYKNLSSFRYYLSGDVIYKK